MTFSTEAPVAQPARLISGDAEQIFEGLNPEQRRAVLQSRGPVCILAGAGSGKTTTITRRIAWQVASSSFPADQILAVTFTDKAAGEMRSRLKALGVEGVTARTFHSAALGQLRWLAPERTGEILPSKGLIIRRIANTLPRPFCYRHASDLAQEIERAKNRRVTPSLYLESLNGHEPPLPPDLMERVYRHYEREKSAAGRIDFEDLLELAIRLYEEDEQAALLFRERFRAFTVDEYQDVNLLQQTLLDLWLGERSEICAVGDDYQAIYGFTGASPGYLLTLPERYPGATVVTLESNYRSTPQVLALANRLVPRLGGAVKTLRPTRPDGTEPERHILDGPGEEKRFVAGRIASLHEAEGLPFEEMAILVRTNTRAADFEEVLAEAEIPFQGSSLLERESARFLLRRAATLQAGELARGIRRLAHAQGWVDPPPPRLGDREMTRLADMSRLVRLAEKLDDDVLDGAGFAAEIRRRFDPRASGHGVHLLTYHRAKGLEFAAVFLPRLEEKELPCKLSLQKAEELAEERRLFYVGLTRAKRHLVLSWTERGKPSRFLVELEVAESVPGRRRSAPEEQPPGFEQLRAWRLKRARADGVPAFYVFGNRALSAIAVSRPTTLEELANVKGVGPKKIERYGDEVLAVLSSLANDSETES
jgi:DNA helicase-2/ATP-dependent DNA helicase PcrA